MDNRINLSQNPSTVERSSFIESKFTEIDDCYDRLIEKE